jgi:hypothetical protein
MNGLDTVIFTGGIGQGSAGVRSLACQGLSCMGIRLDETKNSSIDGFTGVNDISVDGTPLGRIADFLIDTHSWEIPLLMIKAHDGRVFISHPDIAKSIDVSRRTAASDITQKENADWMEYDPHYMALMSTTE